MHSYWSVLRLRGAQALLLSAFPARIAYSMVGLGIYFKVQHDTHSISTAGLAVGLNGLAGAVTAGLRGSIMDKWGLQWPIRIFIPTYASLILLFNHGHGGTQLVTLAFILGFSAPPVNLSVRPMWKIVVSADLIRTAYAIDTSVMNIVGVFGPVIATTLALSSHPERALQLTAGLMLITGATLSLVPAAKAWIPEKKVKGELPIWRVAGIRLLMLEGVFIGLGMGAFFIGIPAFATQENLPHRAGTILATLAATTVVGGLFAGLISRKTSPLKAFRIGYFFWFIASIPLAFTYPDWSMMLVVGAIGLANGGQQVFYWEITEAVRPRGTAVAALGWLWTVEGTCAALGETLGGYVADHYSPRWCLAATTIAVAIGLFIITVGKNLLAAADKIPTKEEDTEALGDVLSSEN